MMNRNYKFKKPEGMYFVSFAHTILNLFKCCIGLAAKLSMVDGKKHQSHAQIDILKKVPNKNLLQLPRQNKGVFVFFYLSIGTKNFGVQNVNANFYF